jgi:hypothetical protein
MCCIVTFHSILSVLYKYESFFTVFIHLLQSFKCFIIYIYVHACKIKSSNSSINTYECKNCLLLKCRFIDMFHPNKCDVNIVIVIVSSHS